MRRAADWASWGTAFANPSIAVFKAARSADPKCEFLQLAIAEAVAQSATLTLKHFMVSPRPCLGCDNRGTPSGHSAQSVIGLSSSWRVGLFFAIGTGELRDVARRHTKTQVAAGWVIGGLAELLGQKALRCRTS